MAARVFDLEMLLDRVVDFLQNDTFGLNSRISAINAEKNDSLTLSLVNDNAYGIHDLNGKIMNFDPFLFVGVEDISSDGLGPHTMQKFSLQAILVVSDNGLDVAISRRMFRYQRALKEVFETNWSEIEGGIKLKITSLVPAPLQQLNTAKRFRAVGVSIEATLA